MLEIILIAVLVVLLVALYVISFMKKKKFNTEMNTLREELKVGDKVMTDSGVVGEVVDSILEKDGVVLITADHGNADVMWNEEQGVVTAHSTNPVPLIVIGAGDIKLKEGRISDLCPTMLDIMGIEKPVEMTGNSLIVK